MSRITAQSCKHYTTVNDWLSNKLASKDFVLFQIVSSGVWSSLLFADAEIHHLWPALSPLFATPPFSGCEQVGKTPPFLILYAGNRWM
jgi:hypothetical protein